MATGFKSPPIASAFDWATRFRCPPGRTEQENQGWGDIQHRALRAGLAGGVTLSVSALCVAIPIHPIFHIPHECVGSSDVRFWFGAAPALSR
eukprot:9477784-Pyramimonas_sp.AAC.1